MRQMFDGHTSVEYFGGVDPPNIGWTYIRKIFGGSTPPKYLTDVCPSNILGVHTP